MTSRFYIINEVDRPYARHVCELVNEGLCYMSRSTNPSMASYDGMSVRPDSTPVEDFGFTIEDHGDQIAFTKTSDSKATYKDGKPRDWQGERYFTLDAVNFDQLSFKGREQEEENEDD